MMTGKQSCIDLVHALSLQVGGQSSVDSGGGALRHCLLGKHEWPHYLEASAQPPRPTAAQVGGDDPRMQAVH